jgi:hypothetical protein
MQSKIMPNYRSQFFALAFGATLLFLFTISAVHAQDETDPATQSNLTGVPLPTGARRVREQHIPAEINQSLEKLLAAGEGNLRPGNAEVLAWSGAGYKKAKASSLLTQLQSNLQAQGWTYETSVKEGEVTVFSAVKPHPSRRAVLGFYVPTDDALVIAWTEVLSANNAAQPTGKPAQRASGNALLGTWQTGGMSMMADRNRITGATTPSNGNTMKYVFLPNGQFEMIGMLQSTMYGCTTTLFNDKRGSYVINGSTVTLTPHKNYWRQQHSCAPNSNKERNYTLTPETLQWRTKSDEYGKAYICLANDKGESCYRRAE